MENREDIVKNGGATQKRNKAFKQSKAIGR
jgi:hypothetical protein